MSRAAKNILIMANYSNKTGFAWNNIYKLFGHISNTLSANGVNSFISFSQVQEPLSEQYFSSFKNYFTLEPNSRHAQELRKIRKIILHNKIDCLYLTDQPSYSIIYAYYRLCGIKKIIVHNRISVASPDIPSSEKGVRPALKWIIARLPYINCDRTYTVSNFVKMRLVNKAKVRPDKIDVILNGIDTTKFLPEKSNTTNTLNIYSGGRATKLKGFQYLFEAAEILIYKKGIENFVINYAGDGPDIGYLKDLVEKKKLSSHVKFLGEVPSTHELQNDADLIVVPSIWGDACPSAVSEALASGRPLIATAAGGIPEMIGGDKNAIVVPHSDAAAIANAIEKLIKNADLRANLSKAGRARAENTLNANRYYDDVIKALTRDLEL